MKNSLTILTVVISLFALGGVYAYRQMNKSPGVNVPSYGLTGSSSGGGSTPTQAPLSETSLSVLSPVNNSTVTTPDVLVSGKTLADADVAVNDTDIKADGSGNFSTTLTLDEGSNTINVVASDANGNVSEQELSVTYSPPGQ